MAFVLVLARSTCGSAATTGRCGGLLRPFAIALVPAVALILKQPDLGVAALFVPTLLAMLFAAGAKVRHMAAVLGGGGWPSLPVFWFSGQPNLPLHPPLARP